MIPWLALAGAGLVDAGLDAKRRSRLHEMRNRLGMGAVVPEQGTWGRLQYVEKQYGTAVARRLRIWLREAHIAADSLEVQRIDPLLPWLGRELAARSPPYGPSSWTESGKEWTDAELGRFFSLHFPDLGRLVDWAVAAHPNLFTMNLPAAVAASDEWHLALPVAPPRGDVHQGEIVYRWEDGWSVQKLTTRKQIEDEGAVLQHCVATYWGAVAEGRTEIYSLREEDGTPKATWEFNPRSQEIVQLKGYQDQVPAAWDDEDAKRKAFAFSRTLTSNLSDWGSDAVGLLIGSLSEGELVAYLVKERAFREGADSGLLQALLRDIDDGYLGEVATAWAEAVEEGGADFLPPQIAAAQAYLVPTPDWIERIEDFERNDRADEPPFYVMRLDRRAVDPETGAHLHLRIQAMVRYSISDQKTEDGLWVVAWRSEGALIHPDGTVEKTPRYDEGTWPIQDFIEPRSFTPEGAERAWRWMHLDTRGLDDWFEDRAGQEIQSDWKTQLGKAFAWLEDHISEDPYHFLLDHVSVDPAVWFPVQAFLRGPGVTPIEERAQKALPGFERYTEFPWTWEKEG